MDALTRDAEDPRTYMEALLDAQRAAFEAEGKVVAETRIDRLSRAIRLLVDHADDLVAAMSRDFGNRPEPLSKFADIAHPILQLKYARARVRKWLRPERRRLEFPLGLLGARAAIHYQPLGVVGVVSPWNFPVVLTFGPLAGILAAGNRCMIKPSEHTPATSALIDELVSRYFDPTVVAMVTGGAETGAAFTRLAFDHLLFTGSTGVARQVLKAAAENLVPVTLELGGKSPVIVGKGADLAEAAARVMAGKMMNAGQICLAPDYVFVPRDRMGDFLGACERAVSAMYPKLEGNPDYGAMISASHVERLRAYLADARRRRKEVRTVNPSGESFAQTARKLPLSLVIDPDDDNLVMTEEIFGPVLSLKPYDDIRDVVAFVNARPRPLALYYFGGDRTEEAFVIENTTSGGVTVNDVLAHVAVEDLPFGGVGASGMGAYHGIHGFRRFSHAKSVFRQSRFNLAKMLGQVPPYGKRAETILSKLIKY